MGDKSDKETIWKTTTVTGISCIVLMVGFWLVEAKAYVTENKVSEMIQKESPYVIDKELVRATLNEVRLNLSANTAVLNELNVEIAKLREKLDSIERQ